MLRSLSTKFFFAILAALLFVIALIGILYKYVEQRERMRMHASVEVGGNPRRGHSGRAAGLALQGPEPSGPWATVHVSHGLRIAFPVVSMR